MTVTLQPHRAPARPKDNGPCPRRWTRAEYHRAAKVGIFGPDERLELLDGQILVKARQLPPHACCVSRAMRLLPAALGTQRHARTRMPIVLNDESEPEPDVAIVAGTEFDYVREHPKAADVLLLVEVSETTLRLDRGRKRSAYARAGIREYWILNLVDRQLEVYRNPSRGRYRNTTFYRDMDTVAPLAAPDAAIRVADLLPPTADPVPSSQTP